MGLCLCLGVSQVQAQNSAKAVQFQADTFNGDTSHKVVILTCVSAQASDQMCQNGLTPMALAQRMGFVTVYGVARKCDVHDNCRLFIKAGHAPTDSKL